MEDETKPASPVNFSKWLLLVFGILTSFSFLTLVLSSIRPRGQSSQASFLILSAIAAPLFLTAFFALQKRKPYGRWLGVISFTFGTCNVTWGIFWYFFVYVGPPNIFTTALVVGLDVVQFTLLSWGALTLAFPPKISGEDTPAESLLPPPPPTFDD